MRSVAAILGTGLVLVASGAVALVSGPWIFDPQTDRATGVLEFDMAATWASG